jgi:hypothetical protein
MTSGKVDLSRYLIPKDKETSVTQYGIFGFYKHQVSRKTLQFHACSSRESNPAFQIPNKNKQIITKLGECLNSYLLPDGLTRELFSTHYGQNSVQISDKVVSHFPVRMYKVPEDLTKTFITPAILSE